MTSKKIPERMCVVCRSHKEKRELLRVVLNKEEGMCVDVTGKKNGRGAYICKDMACIDKAEKSDALSRAFKREVDKSFYEQIRKEVAKDE